MIYEHPLNEQVRLCLRLEYLFSQAEHYLNKKSAWDSHQMLKIILEIMQAIERSDLKSKFYQILNQHSLNLPKLAKLQDIDQEKLSDTIKKIDSIIKTLDSDSEKIGEKVRKNEFLTGIQQRLHTPAGTCGFSLPAYQLWLQQPAQTRQTQLLIWFDELSLLQDIVNIILKLMREGTPFKGIVAHNGFYKNNLSPGTSYQMIRIQIPNGKNLFPEISIGRYRLAIYFFNLDIDGKSTQTSDDLSFKLACCKT